MDISSILMTERMNMELLFLTCIYGWDPRFRSVIIFRSVMGMGGGMGKGMGRPNWNMRALFSDSTAERVGARHDCLHQWSS